jgi:hypothetical protein
MELMILLFSLFFLKDISSIDRLIIIIGFVTSDYKSSVGKVIILKKPDIELLKLALESLVLFYSFFFFTNSRELLNY